MKIKIEVEVEAEVDVLHFAPAVAAGRWDDGEAEEMDYRVRICGRDVTDRLPDSVRDAVEDAIRDEVAEDIVERRISLSGIEDAR